MSRATARDTNILILRECFNYLGQGIAVNTGVPSLLTVILQHFPFGDFMITPEAISSIKTSPSRTCNLVFGRLSFPPMPLPLPTLLSLVMIRGIVLAEDCVVPCTC